MRGSGELLSSAGNKADLRSSIAVHCRLSVDSLSALRSNSGTEPVHKQSIEYLLVQLKLQTRDFDMQTRFFN